jgi:hypothetical protein
MPKAQRKNKRILIRIYWRSRREENQSPGTAMDGVNADNIGNSYLPALQLDFEIRERY